MPDFLITTPDHTRHTVGVAPGSSVLDACRQAGLPLEGLCGGEMNCSTCHVQVDPAWHDRLPPASEAEEDMLDLVPTATGLSRLGCQLKACPALDGLPVTIVPAA